MLLLIDNYDSFTHNLARYFCELGQEVVVKRNDEISVEQVRRLAPEFLVLSPGPCTPDTSGVCLEAIRAFSGVIPMLGVCLGHQAIGQVYGASVVRAQRVMHGKTDVLRHRQGKLFTELPQAFSVTRYHSLVLEPETVPPEFEVSAWCQRDGEAREVMAIEHQSMPLCGVQFHPESVMTEHGHQVLQNFLSHYG